MYKLNDENFNYISDRIYEYAKIKLTEKKRSLIISRLSKRIRILGLADFKEYVDFLKTNSDEFQEMVDALSTNYSLFFRESHHMEFLTERILPEHKTPIKVWSAASSTGQEIYSILITLLEYNRKTDRNLQFNLFASDISSKALSTACKGVFPKQDTKKIDPKILKKYFLSGTGTQSDFIKVKKDLIKKISFFKLNLDDEVYRLPLMNVIFLRNVIIYFDKETKQRLIDRLYDYMVPGGYLILGHSESLSGISDKYILRGKTIYQRKDL